PLPGLRVGAVPVDHEVRLALRLAVVLRPLRLRRRTADRGPRPRHGPHRGPLRDLRLTPRPRLRRRAADADRRSLLHEQHRADIRACGWGDLTPRGSTP